jgi:succinyl-CoA synthetase beta subunit
MPKLTPDQEKQACEALIKLGALETEHALHSEGVRAIRDVLQCSTEDAKTFLGDLRVRNVFGGILRCDMLAAGVVKAARELAVKAPVVVRMEGTNVEEGRRILLESGLNFTIARDMRDAAEKVVRLASQGATA